MKNMKKLWALLLALAMVLSLAACGGTSDGETAADDQTTEDTATDETTETDSDLAYVQDKGSLVVGITYFAPMDYKAEGSDEWIGFDADLAKLFAESLGVSVEFQEITWDYKVAVSYTHLDVYKRQTISGWWRTRWPDLTRRPTRPPCGPSGISSGMPW